MLSASAIKKYLPHRYPYLLVDKVLDIVTGEKIVAIKNVTINEECLQSHFPDNPIMPGTMILEVMAQVTSILAIYDPNITTAINTQYLLAAIDEVQFRQPVFPGDQLYITASIIERKLQIIKCQVRAMVNQQLVCRAVLTGANKSVTYINRLC